MGRKYLHYLADSLTFVINLHVEEGRISGTVPPAGRMMDEDSRLKEPGVFDLLRLIAFKLKPKIKLDLPLCGLFGMISYDAIDYFESLPKQEDDHLPELVFYWATHLFVIDHVQRKTYLIAGFPVLDTESDGDYFSCIETIRQDEEVFRQVRDFEFGPSAPVDTVDVCMSDDEFAAAVRVLKDHIAAGDVFQCVLSRSFQLPMNWTSPFRSTQG